MNIQLGGCFPLICALIGMMFLGPAGAITGFILGSILNSKGNSYSRNISDTVLYHISALFAAVMKTDRRIMQSELYSYRDFFLQHFGTDAASKAIDYLKTLKDQDINIQEHVGKLNLKLNYTERMEILRYLFQLAYADGDIGNDELNLIRRIAQYFQIRQSDYEYIQNVYSYYYSEKQRYSEYSGYSGQNQRQYGNSRSGSLDADYAILGIRSDDSDDAVKKAYRRLAIDNHPDKVAHLGESARKEAEKRFAQINEAYQRIKKARNMS